MDKLGSSARFNWAAARARAWTADAGDSGFGGSAKETAVLEGGVWRQRRTPGSEAALDCGTRLGRSVFGAPGNGTGTDFSGGGTLRSGNGESGVVTR